MRIPECVVLLIVALWAAGCASTSAPRGFLPNLDAMGQNVHGGWAECTLMGGVAAGELLAVDADSVWLLSGGRLRVVPMHRVSSMFVTGYNADYGAMAIWTVLGTASTLSHGLVLVLSAPVWLIVGTISTVSYSYISRESVTRRELDEPVAAARAIDRLRIYARFPQGLPPIPREQHP
jgi:hypothetical protein